MRRKKVRQKEVKLRKNFFPALVIIVTLWSMLAAFVYFIDPQNLGATPIFLLIAFATFTFTFTLLFAHTRRGLLASLTLIIFLMLGYFGIGNILNLLLLTALAITAEVYFTNR